MDKDDGDDDGDGEEDSSGSNHSMLLPPETATTPTHLEKHLPGVALDLSETAEDFTEPMPNLAHEAVEGQGPSEEQEEVLVPVPGRGEEDDQSLDGKDMDKDNGDDDGDGEEDSSGSKHSMLLPPETTTTPIHLEKHLPGVALDLSETAKDLTEPIPNLAHEAAAQYVNSCFASATSMFLPLETASMLTATTTTTMTNETTTSPRKVSYLKKLWNETQFSGKSNISSEGGNRR